MKSEAYIVTCLTPMVIILRLCILALDVILLERVPISRRHMCNLRLCTVHQLDLVIMTSATVGVIPNAEALLFRSMAAQMSF